MRVRKLDAAGDMTFGHGVADFHRDVPEAPAQCVLTRLRLELGEWWLNTADGTDWATQVLGRRTEATRDPVIRERIAGTQGVSSISAYSSQLDRETRAFTVQAEIETIYGTATVTGTI